MTLHDLRRHLRLPSLCAVLLLCAACATPVPDEQPGLDRDLVSRAVQHATELRAAGQRVWCVPFARNASGIEIRGNAGTWWNGAEGIYDRGHRPAPGAVMVFRSSGSMPMGHVAVVSQVISEREIRIDHANWLRNQVSLGMTAIDVSEKNDWSAVRVESGADSFGRINPVAGFIFNAPARG